MKDQAGIEITRGSVVNINQTVNGCCLFVVLKLNPLDIRYAYDLRRKYEYDKRDLLSLDYESDIDMVGNIYDYIFKL